MASQMTRKGTAPAPVHIGGSACVLSGRACHSALRCRAGFSRGRGTRPGTGWTGLGEPIGGWPGSRCRAAVGGGPVMRRNPCGGHGRPPSGPPATEGAVLICPCAAGRRGLPDGGSTRFMGVQLGGKVTGEGAVAAAGGCRRAVLGWAPRDAAAAVRSWHGAPSRLLPSSFPQVTGPGLRSRVALPPLLADEMPARQGSVVLAWAGDRSPIRGCTTTGGDRVPRTR
jgi:hypothetical protein